MGKEIRKVNWRMFVYSAGLRVDTTDHSTRKIMCIKLKIEYRGGLIEMALALIENWRNFIAVEEESTDYSSNDQRLHKHDKYDQ